MNVILMGPPGSGKGTQAANLAEKLVVDAVSSGDLFRDHQRRDTELGRLARSYMERGVYVPDEVTINMIMDWIGDPDHAAGFVLDGFPRTQSQAEALDEALTDRGGIDRVVFIKVSDDELVQRLSGRILCTQCQRPYNLNSSPPLSDGRCDGCRGVCTSATTTSRRWSQSVSRCTTRRPRRLSSTTAPPACCRRSMESSR